MVDDGSTPPESAIPRTRHVRHPEQRGLNAARNTGLRVARSGLVVFVDDDVETPPTWLRSFLVGAGRYPDAWCFGGPLLLRVEDGSGLPSCAGCDGGRAWESERDDGLAEGQIDGYVCGGNFAVRRSAIEAVGAFDETRPIYFEEYEWEDRVRASGGSIVWLPDAWLWHRRVAESLQPLGRIARSFRQGLGLASYIRSRGGDPGAWQGEFIRRLGHGVRHRCFVGILDAARMAGLGAGSLLPAGSLGGHGEARGFRLLAGIRRSARARRLVR